jgi:hypothetical protein
MRPQQGIFSAKALRFSCRRRHGRSCVATSSALSDSVGLPKLGRSSMWKSSKSQLLSNSQSSSIPWSLSDL